MFCPSSYSKHRLKMVNHTLFIVSLFCLFSINFYASFSMDIDSSGNNFLVSFDVGVILDLSSPIGRVGWSCIFMAISDFYAAHPNYRTRLTLHARDSQGDNVKAAFAALDLIDNVHVQAIIGPQKSRETDFVIELGDKAQVPIISFSATSPSLSLQTPYFIQAALNDSSQVNAVTAIIQAFTWRELVVIYEDSDYGSGLVPYLMDSCEDINARIAYRSVISLSATDDQILAELYKLMAMPTRIFVVHMTGSVGARLLLKAKELGMMTDGYVWIITDGLMNVLDSMDTSVVASMQGVLGVKPFIKTSRELDAFTIRWRKRFHQEYPDMERAELNIYGLWAYDAVWALAVAAEEVGVINSRDKIANGVKLSTDKNANGVKLLHAILKTRFKGLIGDFYLIDGQLQSSMFQILNVIGKGEREVGFWSPECGISRELNLTCGRVYTTSLTNFRSIIWPGESMVVPKGWVIPNTGRKLRIGVPIKGGFNDFVRVDHDPYTNRTTTSGYIIEFFNAVMDALPYPIAYEFVPFEKADGSSAGSHNEMVYQVYLQGYDAVVGDTTITANRSLHVDFTFPYTEGGVAMLVPIKYEDRKNGWIFLKPLTKDLWLISGAFFILTGFVIWLLEHRINDAFRGPPSQHIGMMFWFSFSTLVFAHRERVVSNMTRFVVIVWIFVVLILNSSYTASLSSMLTVEKLQPAVTSIQQLVKNGDYVAVQRGSFIVELLKWYGFDESKIKQLDSYEELDEALQKESEDGGIAAFFDVMAYIKLFASKSCDKYTIVGPIHKTEGFGFVFPKGSPLVADVSRAILNMSEGGKLMEIDRAWFEFETACLEPRRNAMSGSLKFSSFRGLFTITGTVSGFALLVFLIVFLYKHKHILTALDSENSFLVRLKTMFKQFDEKDPSSYHYKMRDINKGRLVEVRDFEHSPISISSSSTSTYTVRNFSPVEGTIAPFEGMVSVDLEDCISDSSVVEDMVDVRLSD